MPQHPIRHTIRPPHDEATQEILNAAGMSRNSELTPLEFRNCARAGAYRKDNPSCTRDTLYRIIRPRRDDE